MAAEEAANPGSVPDLPSPEQGGSRSIVYGTPAATRPPLALSQLLRVGFVDDLQRVLATCLRRCPRVERDVEKDPEEVDAEAAAALLREELRPLVFEEIRTAVDEEVRAILQEHKVCREESVPSSTMVQQQKAAQGMAKGGSKKAPRSVSVRKAAPGKRGPSAQDSDQKTRKDPTVCTP